MIIDHNNEIYRSKLQKLSRANRYNGAFYYSKEIVENIIPLVKTDRNWITIKVSEVALDHSIVFIHNNLRPERYNFLSKYNDLILVCGIPETCRKLDHLGKTIYITLSVDTEYVKQFKVPDEKQNGICYVGRKDKTNYGGIQLPPGIDYVSGLERNLLLQKLAYYKEAYAVGRTAIEAKILGLNILPFDPRYPNTNLWQPFDNKDAAKMLQKELDKID